MITTRVVFTFFSPSSCLRRIRSTVVPTASSRAVQPPTEYCFPVIFLISPISTLSWMSSNWVLKRTVDTMVFPFSFFCLAIIELNPPMVSDSSPDMDPLLSMMKTSSVIS